MANREVSLTLCFSFGNFADNVSHGAFFLRRLSENTSLPADCQIWRQAWLWQSTPNIFRIDTYS
jgi:hypothetical protein